MRRIIQRSLNALRKVRSGLTLFGENVSPEVPNDLFIAHLSLYHFFARYCEGSRVLDIGCGAGYGDLHLLQHGASEVVGVDIDPRNIRYASKVGAAVRRATFIQADAERLPSHLGSFDVVISSNVFEHLNRVSDALSGVVRSLVPGAGRFILAVPPIVDENSMKANEAIPYHRTNLAVGDWHALLCEFFDSVTAYRHLPPDGVTLDFGDPFPSTVDYRSFQFTEVDPLQYNALPSLTALFECAVPRQH